MNHRAITFLAALIGAGIAAAIIASHQNSVSVASSSTPTATTNAAGQTLYSYTMPASSSPTRCSAWLQGHDATIIFSSESLDVNPACDSWVTSSAAGGELWIENKVANDSLETICSLQDGDAVAIVRDSQGGFFGQQACTSLIAGGWTESSTP